MKRHRTSRELRRLAIVVLFAATANCQSAQVSDAPTASASVDNAPICRTADFAGCCSWNNGLLDYFKGVCRNKLDSQKCDAKWDVSLRGRCSGKGGVLRVEANGKALCVKGGESLPRIPKCNAS